MYEENLKEQECKENLYRQNLEDQKEEIRQELKKEEDAKSQAKMISSYWIIAGIVLLVINIVLKSFNVQNSIAEYIILGISSIFVVAGIMCIAIGVIYLATVCSSSHVNIMRLKERKIEIMNELELIDISEKSYERRAEVQFKNHQRELKRYYDINLGQFKIVFPLGVITIIIGIAIILLSIILFKDTVKENILPTLIGSISGILIDFVGVIFIKMYKETINTTAEFHNKLIQSNNNLFANVLVTQIRDGSIKDQTVAEMAKALSMNTTDNKKDNKADK